MIGIATTAIVTLAVGLVVAALTWTLALAVAWALIGMGG